MTVGSPGAECLGEGVVLWIIFEIFKLLLMNQESYRLENWYE